MSPARFTLVLSLGALCLGPALPALAEDGPITLDKHITPLLQKYCTDCHNADKSKGDVDLATALKNPRLLENRDLWAKVAETMENGDMPPAKKPQPEQKEKDLVVHFVDGELSKLDCSGPQNPGRVTLRRLNKEEYRNTVRDLVQVDFRGDDFPNDEVGYGFDNIGDVLSLSPMLMEKYLAAAEEVATKAIQAGPVKPPVKKFPANQFEVRGSYVRKDDGGSIIFSSAGAAEKKLEFPAPGPYRLRFQAYGDQVGSEPARVVVKLDGVEAGRVDVPATSEKPGSYEVPLTIDKKSWRTVSIEFVNDYFDLKNPDAKLRGDRNLYLKSVEQEMPASMVGLPKSHRALITKTPEPGEELAVARELLRPLVKRAYRRPVSDEEVERYVGFVDLALKNQGGFLEGMQVAVQAILCSPQFLFRWELDPGKFNPGEVRDLSDFELASRLSYFLWSSMPDQRLLELAEKGELRKNGNLEKEIARMLADWKTYAFVQNFAGQWLQTRGIWDFAVDEKSFPKWSDDLKGLMKEEVEQFVLEIIRKDMSVMDLLDARFTFVNEKLARYYGIPGVKGKEMRRVELPPESPRGGVLTMGGVLLITSTPTRTSPVIRGKWILEQILGTPPPAAPPDVPALNEQSQVNQTASLRERLNTHSTREECAGCHKRMDPLGFALENFDATGAWREKDGKFPIDPAGVLPDGRKFAGPADLKAVLKQGDGFANNMTEKLLIYALGRGLDHNDLCAVNGIVEKSKASGLKFSSLIAAIVNSEPFIRRKTAEGIAQR